jgi:hypothetical protein
MKPYEIGHAAAFEAYRTWTHHSSMYEPISADRSRQREALVGLSVAEGLLIIFYPFEILITVQYRDYGVIPGECLTDIVSEKLVKPPLLLHQFSSVLCVVSA